MKIFLPNMGRFGLCLLLACGLTSLMAQPTSFQEMYGEDNFTSGNSPASSSMNVQTFTQQVAGFSLQASVTGNTLDKMANEITSDPAMFPVPDCLLTVIDFEGIAPASAFGCGSIVNSTTSNDCFSAGDLPAGPSFEIIGAGVLVRLGDGIAGPGSSDVFGADMFFESMQIVLAPGIDAVSFTLYNVFNTAGGFTINVYNAGGTLLLTQPLLSSDAGEFVGITAMEDIGRIEILDVGANGAAQLIDDFAFGNQSATDTEPPVVTCTEFSETYSACPDGLGPNTPNGVWFPIGADGGFTNVVGGNFTSPLDFTSCITDDCNDLADLETTLGRSYIENLVPGCSVDIINKFIIRDAAENEAADSITFRGTIMFDGPAPAITCAADSLIDCGVVPTVMVSDATATSGCGTPVVTVSDAVIVGEPNEIGTTYTFTFTATDGCGQTSTCDQVFTVQDDTPPVVDCLAAGVVDFTVACRADLPPVDFDIVIANSTDNCDIDFTNTDLTDGRISALTIIPGNTGCPEDTINVTRTYTIHDVAGNTAECRQVIQIVSANGPTIVCPADSLINCGVTPIVDVADAVATFECDFTGNNVAVTGPVIDGVENTAGTTYTYTYTATDGCGRMASCDQVFTVQDTIAPVIISCVTDTTIYLDENGFASIAPGELLVTTDDCAPALVMVGDPLVAFNCEVVGQTFTFDETDTDVAGNVSDVCIVNITVLDSLPPTAVCMDITVQLDDEGNASIADGGTTGGAPVTEITGSLDDTDPTYERAAFFGSCSPSGFTVEYDEFEFTIDQADTYTFSMQMVDGQDFYFTFYEGDFDPLDPCTNLVASDDDGGPGNEPELMLELDLVPGNYSLIITEFGGTTFTAEGPYTIDVSSANGGGVLIGGGDGGAVTSAIDGGSTDNCGGPLTFEESMTEFTCDNVGPNTVTLTVTDAVGNMSSCDATVTVEDMVPPVITVTPQTVVLSDDDGTATLTVADLASANDACGVESLEASQLLYTCEDIGEVEVIITATDNNGNVSTAPVTVTVEFNQPELACIGEINLTLNDECQALVIPQMLLTGNVACLDVFNWDIVVQDSDPSNGPIIDGCGSFTYSISAGSNGDEPTVGFTNEFAEENWDVDFIDDDPTLETSVEFTDETLTFTTFGQSPINFNEAFASIQLSENGTVSFDFSYNGVDPFTGFFGDFAVIQTSFEGVALMTEFFDNEASGSRTLAVSAGETLTFALSDDGLFALPPNEDLASIFEISNFLFERPTSPFDLDFETCWGVVNAEDKTSPEADFVPADVTLLCVDFESDANNVSTLPNSVSRCYRVDAETGATIAGSMAPALRARLLAGGLTPLVPTFTDGCAQELEVCVSDAVAFGEDADCDDIVLTRTFVATEISTCVSAGGEMNAPAVASYTITFDRPTLADLNTDGIQDVVEYEQCGTVNPTRADYPAPRAGDFPSLIVGDRVFNLRSGEAVCNIGVTYSDGDAIITCPYTYKFIRTYTVIDWCDPSDVRTFIQVVKVGDTTAPVLTGPNVETNDAGDLVYGTNAGNICAAYLRLDDVSVVDNCSGTNVSVTAEIFPGGDDTGSPIGAFTVVPGGTPELSSAIPAGRHLLRYTSTDECGNTAIDDFFFVVEDQTPPVAICEDGLNISIAGADGNGFAVLTPDHIDAGSYDDCSGVSLSIARVNSSDLPIGTYGPQIALTCADIGTVRVGLRVEDALGNVNYCWLDVLVEDKLRPTCVAPANTTISCVEYNTTLPADIQDATDAQLDAIFGAAAGVDNCNTTITQSISGDVNSCGVGTFTRTFVSTDDAGFTNAGACTQRIDVIGIHDYRLTFPTDESGDCADIPEYDGIGAEELACDLITTTTDVDTLRTLDAGDECFKLRITYDVVNWCEYNSLGDPYLVTRDGSGVNNRQRQPRNIDEDVLYVNVIPNNTAGTGDDQAFMTLFTDRALNTNAPQRDVEFVGYAGSDSRGFFRYTQFIKIYDEVAPEITFTELDECFAGSGEGCRTTVVIEFTALDECSDAVVGVELDANYVEAAGFNADNAAALGIGVTVENDGAGNYTVTATNVPVGAHALRVRASDGCGNFDVQIIEFCVTADRTPTPICIQTLTVVLMDDGNGGGTAAIWASDFIASPIEDCFGNEVTKYSLFRSSVAGAAGFVPSFNPPATNGIDDIDCADFEAGTVSVRVYAFDDNGSTPDYCEVVVEVQDNAGWCDDGGSGNIAGLITDQDDVAVENVSVTLTGAMDRTTTTDASGQFSFTGLPLDADYTVQPALDAPVNLRNVKSSDLVSMIGQILGTTTFDSPYDFVAADVNRDMELNIFDVVNVSQVILGQVDMFEGGDSWVFVEANMAINVNTPYAATFPEVYNANDLAGTVRADFLGVEVGNPFGVSNRTALNLQTDDAQLEAGQTHTIVLDGTELAAFQGTLELGAGLELIGAEYTGEGGMNLNRAGEGMIAVALRTPSPTPPHGGGATENASRFGVTLTVRATTAVTLSEELRLTDAITVREGVGANGVGNGLDLAFNGDLAPASAQNVLHQNTPNPVSLETVIRFELAAAAPATLTLRDVAGRLISVQEIDAAAGMNTVELTNIKASGVLTYTLTAGEFTASRKMVVVK